jgi:hypothetical protein
MLCFHWWLTEVDREVIVDIVTIVRDEKTWGLGHTWACNGDEWQITGGVNEGGQGLSNIN